MKAVVLSCLQIPTFAIAYGFSMNAKDDHDNMSMQFYVYDALYSFCKWKLK
jgi:hypothetical protein